MLRLGYREGGDTNEKVLLVKASGLWRGGCGGTTVVAVVVVVVRFVGEPYRVGNVVEAATGI